MPFVPNSACAMVELVQSMHSQVIENTLYFDLGVVPGVIELTDIATIVRDWWLGHIRDKISSAVSLTSVRATSLQSETAPGVEITASLPAAGLITASPSLPANVTGCITFVTALRGRSFRGRNYIPGLTEAMVTNSTIDNLTVADFVSGYEELLIDLSTEPYDWVVYSRFTANAPRAIGVMTDVVSCKMDQTVDSQRRRLPGRGR